jgi:hypothetical protein
MNEKIKSIAEATERLKVRITDFERSLAEEKSIAFLKRAKKAGLISTFTGDKDYKPESPD